MGVESPRTLLLSLRRSSLRMGWATCMNTSILPFLAQRGRIAMPQCLDKLFEMPGSHSGRSCRTDEKDVCNQLGLALCTVSTECEIDDLWAYTVLHAPGWGVAVQQALASHLAQTDSLSYGRPADVAFSCWHHRQELERCKRSSGPCKQFATAGKASGCSRASTGLP